MKDIRLSFVVFLLMFLMPVTLYASGIELETQDTYNITAVEEIKIIYFPNNPTTIYVGQSYTDYVEATGKGTIKYSFKSEPEVTEIRTYEEKGKLFIEWIPEKEGEYKITVLVEDYVDGKLYNKEELYYTLKVILNTAPSVTLPSSSTILLGFPYTNKVTATDKTPTSKGLIYTLKSEPVTEGMIIDNYGNITWTPKTVGKYTIYITVSDGYLKTTGSYTLEVVENTPPSVTLPPSATILLGISYTGKVTATDKTPTSTGLMYSLKSDPVAEGIIIDNYGNITWTPKTVGKYIIYITVSDGYLETTGSYTLSVIQNTPP